MTRTRKSPAIRVRCPRCDVQTVTADDIGFTHRGGTVTGWFWRCRGCDRLHSAVAEPTVLALLHAVGAHGLLAEPGPTPVEPFDHRSLVSLRILLDHPQLLASAGEVLLDEPGPDQADPTGDVTSRP